jgi:multisubunit Na+/H+ antiporter MnhB subunit
VSRFVVAIGLAVIVLVLAPIVLLGEHPTTATLMPIPVALLVMGLVLRRQPDPRSRSIARAVLVAAVLGFLALVVLYAIARGGSGRL